jgi:hypothetical protein
MTRRIIAGNSHFCRSRNATTRQLPINSRTVSRFEVPVPGFPVGSCWRVSSLSFDRSRSAAIDTNAPRRQSDCLSRLGVDPLNGGNLVLDFSSTGSPRSAAHLKLHCRCFCSPMRTERGQSNKSRVHTAETDRQGVSTDLSRETARGI